MLELIDTAEIVTRCTRKLRAGGLEVRQVSDISEVQRLMATMPAPYVTPYLDPRKNQFTEKNTLWLFLIDKDGDAVGKIAARHDDTGRETLRSYARRVVSGMHPTDNALTPSDRFPEIMKKMRGQIVYIGELYLPKPYASFLNVRAMVRLVYSMIYLKWGEPDWVYCYMKEEHAKAAKRLYGFPLLASDAISFTKPPSHGTREHWLSAASGIEFISMIDPSLPQVDSY